MIVIDLFVFQDQLEV